MGPLFGSAALVKGLPGDGFIHGTIIAAEYEWILHNIAYIFTGNKNAKDVNIGHTVFKDKGHGILGLGMKIFYLMHQLPIISLIEIFMDGWGDDFEE